MPRLFSSNAQCLDDINFVGYLIETYATDRMKLKF